MKSLVLQNFADDAILAVQFDATATSAHDLLQHPTTARLPPKLIRLGCDARQPHFAHPRRLANVTQVLRFVNLRNLFARANQRLWHQTLVAAN